MKKLPDKPLISVVVAAFNQERFIGRCLRSLLHQTLAQNSYEIIVVDDGSTDRTAYALSLFTDNNESIVTVATHEPNMGLPTALNTGIKAARSPYLIRVDADDFVNQHFLNFLLYYLESNLDADAVACDYLLVDDDGKVIKRCSCTEKPIACGILFHKDHLFEIGLYDEEFRCQEERELRIRYEKKYKIHRLQLPLYRYRRHDKNITSDTKQMEHHRLKLIDKHASNPTI